MKEIKFTELSCPYHFSQNTRCENCFDELLAMLKKALKDVDHDAAQTPQSLYDAIRDTIKRAKISRGDKEATK